MQGLHVPYSACQGFTQSVTTFLKKRDIIVRDVRIGTIGDVIKAAGVSDVTRKAGIASRTSAYRSFSAAGKPELRTVVPQELVGYGRKARKPQREVLLCIDQSGSMANSVVYASIFGAVLASLPAVATKLVVFDTAIVDLTEQLDDPVDVLFGVQLGGGTDINRAVGYCQGLISEPRNAIVVLISLPPACSAKA